MNQLIYFYLISMALTLLVVICAVGAFLSYRYRSLQYVRLEQTLQERFPKACWYEQLNELVLQSENRLEELKEDESIARELIQQRDAAEARLKELTEQIGSLEVDRQQMEVIQAQLADMQRQEAEINERLPKLSADAAALESRIEQLNETKRQLDEIEGQLDECKIKRSQAREEVAGLEQKIAELKQARESSDRELAGVKEKLEKHSDKLLEVQKEHASLSGEVEELKSRRESLKHEIPRMEKLLTEMLDRVPKEAAAEDERLAELWQPVLPTFAEREDCSDQEERCLDEAKGYFESLGLRFHDRVINAFHTSLKVADISPLLVLAGISGTGKSLLPRRYAEATGMHFMNIAVQPRWDSPQDMFGFFNYLEGRYRATELARALVQMDPYADEEDRGWETPEDWLDDNWRADDMLMVLLDEMNLARVEYYFSEFLSRLEIRRDIDPDSVDDRTKAEIPLEVGMRRAWNGDALENLGTPTLPLYVAGNVLFVGTMNEDESTQTLSDKVIDRANLLRFGKPSSLDIAATASNGSPSAKRLDYATWRQWQRSDDSLDADRGRAIERWIQSLNDDVMSAIGRPFAFRTRLAMRSYIANYPVQSLEGAQVAMADQVEQRILPKLRGLDPGEPNTAKALEMLIKLVDSGLNDKQLSDAIVACRKGGASGHQFVWTGLDRSIAEIPQNA